LTHQNPSKSNLTRNVFIALILGFCVGYVIHLNTELQHEIRDLYSKNIKILSTVFIRMVQMIIAPLVFSTLVVGIARSGDVKTVGRIGAKAMLWFVLASLVSLLIGLFFVNLFEPGSKIVIDALDTVGSADLISKTTQFSLANFVEHVFPRSIVESMASNEILQIVVFSIFFGIACASIGDYAKPVVDFLEILSNIILKIVGYVMNFAPLGVFASISAIVATKGFEIFTFYYYYFIYFMIAIAVLWLVMLTVGYLIIGKRLRSLFSHIGNPLLVAFSTTSSEAVFPKMTEEMKRFGCSEKVVFFVLPLGYSFNLDGSMMYMTFASIAIAQANHIHMDLGSQLSMLLVLMITSKGIAGVPRASLVVIMATLGMFGIPLEGIALILPIDHFCDMFRSATNVLGNSLATIAVSEWENQLKD